MKFKYFEVGDTLTVDLEVSHIWGTRRPKKTWKTSDILEELEKNKVNPIFWEPLKETVVFNYQGYERCKGRWTFVWVGPPRGQLKKKLTRKQARQELVNVLSNKVISEQ